MEMGVDHEGDNAYLQKYIGKYYCRPNNDSRHNHPVSGNPSPPEDPNKEYVTHDDFPSGSIIKLLFPGQKNVKKYVRDQITLHVTGNGYIHKATWG